MGSKRTKNRILQMAMLLTFFICSIRLIGQECQKLPGQWVNELGSALVIDSIGNQGIILGSYHSSTGVDGKIFSLNGWVNAHPDFPNKKAVAFTVKWDGYGSITSWSGYCDQDETGPFIKTLWHLVRPQNELAWERIISNASTFRPLARKE